MLRIVISAIMALTAVLALQAQSNGTLKALQHEDFDLWRSIENTRISPDGRWICYELTPLDGDSELVLYDASQQKESRFSRAEDPEFSADNFFLVFRIKPSQDSLDALRRKKVKKEDFPKDTLVVYDLRQGKMEKIPNVKSWFLPTYWGGQIAWWHEPAKTASVKSDSTKTEPKAKKESSENGSRFVLRHLHTGKETVVPFATGAAFAKRKSAWLVASTGDDSTFQAGVYRLDDSEGNLLRIYSGKAKFKDLTLDEKGVQAAFLIDADTTRARIRNWELFTHTPGQAEASTAVNAESSFMPENWLISEHGSLKFSEDGSKLFFGIAPTPTLPDTNLLEEEIVQVEVWRYDDPLLYTQQKVLLEREKKRYYSCVLHPGQGLVAQLGNLDLPEIRTGSEGNAPTALGYNEVPYLMETSWTGGPSCRDVYAVDVQNGSRTLVHKGLCAVPTLSPSSKYMIWYQRADSSWYAWSVAERQTRRIAGPETSKFYDEIHDVPALPGSYGIAAWAKEDAFVLLYDRYDLWKIDPNGTEAPVCLTNGRAIKTTYRYLNPDTDKRFIDPMETILLHFVNEKDKNEGYATFDLKNLKLKVLQSGSYALNKNILKARNAEKYIFTRQTFSQFPDLQYSSDLATSKAISNANPQQKDFRWGTVELYEWTAADGQKLQGMLVKPQGFDPKKQYPMIVNFYERSSDGIHRYPTPAPGRSSIGYSFYTSRGYLIFNPDVPYREGYPGESAFNAVVSGTASLIDKGFVDPARIGLQGHSWGGYQGAYIITRTNLFRCAEIGAPVVNMISAYGGIRWESGLVRQFQYEQQQSRIAGSPWQFPLRYLENSPIFTMDKVQTPVLILHNDKDGAVPWYQGIEMFTALRRLNKPAWLLNYNEEPHWPVKLQNRRDFQKRMQQFFDHYLLDAPMPSWMERGIPAIEKEVNKGY